MYTVVGISYCYKMTSRLESDFFLCTYYYTTLNMSSETIIVSTYIHNNMYHSAVNRVYNNIELNSFYTRLWRHSFARRITRKHELSATCVLLLLYQFSSKNETTYSYSSTVKNTKTCINWKKKKYQLLIIINNKSSYFGDDWIKLNSIVKEVQNTKKKICSSIFFLFNVKLL